MGLGNSSNRTFLGVSDGRIVQRVKEGTPKAVSRVTKTGEVIWELKYGYVEGVLKNITVHENMWQGKKIKDWTFDIEDEGEIFALQLMYDGRYATSLLKALCNPVIDFSKKLRIMPWMKVVDGKKKLSCYLRQGDEDIQWYFTKEEPHGMPELEQIRFKGEDVWDNGRQMAFLESFVMTNVKPQLGVVIEEVQYVDEFDKAKQTGQAKVYKQEGGYKPDLANIPEDDDLPF